MTLSTFTMLSNAHHCFQNLSSPQTETLCTINTNSPFLLPTPNHLVTYSTCHLYEFAS